MILLCVPVIMYIYMCIKYALFSNRIHILCTYEATSGSACERARSIILTFHVSHSVNPLLYRFEACQNEMSNRFDYCCRSN